MAGKQRFDKYTMTDAKRKKWMKEGRGTGDHQLYKPWLTREDVPSDGRELRLSSVWLRRNMEFLSMNEDRVGLIYEYSLRPKFFTTDLSEFHNDIKEQFPLPLEITIEIAKKIGVAHPSDPKSGALVVITTDIVPTYQGTRYPRTIKQEEELGNPRTIEKFEIERIAWADLNCDWGIILKKDIPVDLAENLRDLRSCYNIFAHSEIERQGIDPEYLKKIAIYLSNTVQNSVLPLAKTCLITDGKYGLIEGTSLLVAKHLIYTQQWNVDLMKPFLTGEPLILKNFQLF